MKPRSILKKFFSVVFAAAVVFTVSVREVHYLFTQHEAHEHCENHLHGEEHHEDCSVCKFDISTFTDNVFAFPQTADNFCSTNFNCFYQSVILFTKTSSNTLRGPPRLA